MDIYKLIDIEKVKQGIKSDSELARRAGWTPQNYHDKKSRGYIRSDDLEKVADALDCDLVITFEPREK